uniref:Sec-independent protein translocase component TatC n=1 Tax=Dictyomenia sonderi TaxID=2007178 RepID=UPI0022FD4C9E|nr:Sec-independent protein translocase component TatC [Dictyomenia sonderi]WAX04268.1 Sec-independent protein translocase component TatC [Dictyomenia sonderi]
MFISVLIKEFSLLFRYFFVTFSLLSFSCLKKFSTILIFFFYPIGKFFKKKLLILHALELINSSFILIVTFTSFFTFIFFIFLLKIFFSSSWYKPQCKLFTCLIHNIFFLLVFSNLFFFLIYFFIFNFGLAWNLGVFDSFQVFDFQFQFLKFIEFQIKNLNLLCFLFFYFSIFFFTLRWVFSWKTLFFFFTQCKWLLFGIIIVLLVLLYSELSFQFFFSVFLTWFFIEFIFFFICWKLQ